MIADHVHWSAWLWAIASISISCQDQHQSKTLCNSAHFYLFLHLHTSIPDFDVLISWYFYHHSAGWKYLELHIYRCLCLECSTKSKKGKNQHSCQVILIRQSNVQICQTREHCQESRNFHHIHFQNVKIFLHSTFSQKSSSMYSTFFLHILDYAYFHHHSQSLSYLFILKTGHPLSLHSYVYRL